MAVYLIVLVTLVAQGALAFYSPPTCPKQLRSSFYASSCPRFIEVVNRIVQADTVQDPQMPAHLIRLMFHDCAVQGCDASVMLQSIPGVPSERDADDNLSFGLMTGGYGTINSIKEQLETICPQVVSCADIIVAAAASGLKAAGGPRIEVRFGRRDGLTSFKAAPDVILPHFHQSPKASLRTMQHIGLNTEDTVALVGTHTIGTANCWRFYDRINGTFDSRLNPAYARKLNATCVPPGPDSGGLWPWLHLDNVTSTKFDNQYYKNLLKGYGLLNTDAGLLDRPDTKMLVQAYAADEAMWKNQYTASFLKLSELSYLVAPQGEIRRHCERVRRPIP